MKNTIKILLVVAAAAVIWYFYSKKASSGGSSPSSVQAIYLGKPVNDIQGAQFVSLLSTGQKISGLLNEDGTLSYQYTGNMGLKITKIIPVTDFQLSN